MLSRDEVLTLIEKMPNQFSFEELKERLLFFYKVKNGLEQSKKNKITPHHIIKKSQGDISI